MKRILIILGIITAIIVGMSFLFKNDSGDGNKEIVSQNSQTISAEIKSVGGQLIDVREPSEYAENHADGAINIPLGNIEKGDFTKIESDKPIYLYCRTGRRSNLAKIALENAGYENIIDIGGLIDWQNDGNKVCSSSTPACS
ncbi:MAG: rhodanese-like domain-containing protein [Candidatus Gastranaerophilales bacterium]|nr:rhodanese-like domain-containing protein [Candidatus Gastranaerophilales bacterium]